MTYECINDVVSKRIDVLLHDTNTSRTSLARLLGVTRSAVTQKFKTGSSFSAEDLAKIADFFGVSTDYLYGRSDSKEM
ncbi:helix-turn-helix domain-containing protein [Bifidobacterium vansinderenii]|uniref:helix-turn-helix domain-containing protein n=1 Tax=Bifidobacterium vansinderenii TaxID=1984871 RepID=UPI000B8ABF4F